MMTEYLQKIRDNEKHVIDIIQIDSYNFTGETTDVIDYLLELNEEYGTNTYIQCKWYKTDSGGDEYWLCRYETDEELAARLEADKLEAEVKLKEKAELDKITNLKKKDDEYRKYLELKAKFEEV
jgi:hypothetical protein